MLSVCFKPVQQSNRYIKDSRSTLVIYINVSAIIHGNRKVHVLNERDHVYMPWA